MLVACPVALLNPGCLQLLSDREKGVFGGILFFTTVLWESLKCFGKKKKEGSCSIEESSLTGFFSYF